MMEIDELTKWVLSVDRRVPELIQIIGKWGQK